MEVVAKCCSYDDITHCAHAICNTTECPTLDGLGVEDNIDAVGVAANEQSVGDISEAYRRGGVIIHLQLHGQCCEIIETSQCTVFDLAGVRFVTYPSLDL